MSKWLNNKIVLKGGKDETWKKFYKELKKPCHSCGYCPYGELVEEFPFSNTKRSCKVFGHDCPVFYHAEPFAE